MGCVCNKNLGVEGPAGVAVSSGVILVSVRARKWRVMRDVLAEMESAFITSDWQFQSPPITSMSL